jgi:purine-cytosine permease-like protein
MKVKAHLAVQHLMLAAALTAGIAACGSSGNSSSGASSSPSTSSPASTAAATPTTAASGSAAAAITANWEAFFNAKTPTAKRVTLLQDGSMFASVIKAQAGSGLASSATAKVTKVTVESPTQAKVTYSILLGGSPALSNQTGVAVNQNGTWKVGVASFCGLLQIENNGSTANLPSACKSAG